MGFLRGFSIAMGANVIVFVLSFLNNKLIYISLDKTDNGLFFLVMRFSLLFALFFGDWLRLSYVNIAGEDSRKIPVLSANGLWYVVCLCLLVFLPVLLVSRVWEGALFGIPGIYLAATVLTGIALILRNLWQSLLLVKHHMFSYGMAFILWAGLFLLVNVFILVVFDAGLRFVVAALVAATFASGLWAFCASHRFSGHRFGLYLEPLGTSFRVGLRAWFAVLGMFVMINIQTFSLQAMAPSPAEGLVMVAMFSICYRMFLLFQRGADVAGTVLFSHVVQKDDASSYRMTSMVTRNIVLISLLFSVLVVALGKYMIIIIADANYLDAYYPLVFMLPGILSVNAGSVINNYYWGRKYPLKILLPPFIAAAAGLGIMFLLVPSLGVAGASISFSAAGTAWCVYQAWMFARDSGYPVPEILVPRMADLHYLAGRVRALITERRL